MTITAPGTTGPYTVCLAGASPMRLWHYEGGVWVDRTNAAPGDYVGGKVCGTTTTLSPFASAPITDTTAPVFSKPISVAIRTGVALPSASTASAVPVTLTWLAADEALGSGLDHYTLQQSLNGGAWSAITPVPALATSVAVNMPTAGSIAYKVTACDAKANCSISATGTLTPRITQQTSSLVKFSGAWYLYKLSSLSGASVKYGKVKGAYASFTFTGRGIGFVSMRGTGRGYVSVYIDGKLKTKVYLYRSSSQVRYVAWQTVFPTSGKHTIKLVVAGTAGKPRVDLDGFVVIK